MSIIVQTQIFARGYFQFFFAFYTEGYTFSLFEELTFCMWVLSIAYYIQLVYIWLPILWSKNDEKSKQKWINKNEIETAESGGKHKGKCQA